MKIRTEARIPMETIMETSQKTVLHVEGMTCGHCVKHVTTALQKVPGVTAVEVRLAEKDATITSAGAPPSLEAMIAAVEDAGYEAKPAAA